MRTTSYKFFITKCGNNKLIINKLFLPISELYQPATIDSLSQLKDNFFNNGVSSNFLEQ